MTRKLRRVAPTWTTVLVAAAICFVWADSMAEEAPPRLRLVTVEPEVALGAAFEVGVERVDPEDRLDGSVVTAVRFESIDDAWHVAAAWSQPLPGEPTPAGWLWRARLQAWEVGARTLPTARALLQRPDGSREEIALPPLSIRVVEGLDEADVALRDLKPIREVEREWRGLAAGALAALAAALALAFFARRMFGTRGPLAEAPPIPPGVWALGEIARRRDFPACRAGESKAIATEAADVLRRYIQRRFGVPALEMTTAECVERLRAQRVPGGIPEEVKSLLDECDLAKFTKIALPENRREAIWDDAAALIRRSTARSELSAVSAARPAEGAVAP
jgi:hypothetical protein